MLHRAHRIIFFLLLFLPRLLHAETAPQKTICLNMIVKDEKAVISRCLASVLPIIDYWVIVDTGSTDGTQTIIKDFMKMKGVPGELHERPWKNFSHNRNEALELAKGKADYVFFIDADEFLMYDPDFTHPTLDKDYYYVTTKADGMLYARLLLVNNHKNWKWEGVLHETICPPEAATWDTLAKVKNITTHEGARAKDPDKLQKDIAIMEAALQEDPKSSRYVFYLGQTYFALRNFKEALKYYEKRLTMGGFDQEIFWSKLRIAQLKELFDAPQDEIVERYKSAYDSRPLRVEPLFFLAHYLRKKGEYAMGYDVAKIGLTLPPSKDILFVEQWMFDYGLLLEFSICSFWVERYEESQKASIALLRKADLPFDVRATVEQNLSQANSKLLALLGTKKSTSTNAVASQEAVKVGQANAGTVQ